MPKTQVAILISGRGSNLQSLIDATSAEDFPAEIVLVISNRPKAKGLKRAEKANIPTLVIDHKAFGDDDTSRAEFDSEITRALEAANVSYVCLAGFMRLLSPQFVERWRGKLLNIHPSLLPAFKGVNVHQRMIEQGVKIAGCTVHFVTAEMDAGPIVGQAALAVKPDDNEATLSKRILELEHRLYPECLRQICDGKARPSGGRVVLSGEAHEDASISMPKT
jgi:phosphoribosylglycinamide formyltransferase-1